LGLLAVPVCGVHVDITRSGTSCSSVTTHCCTDSNTTATRRADPTAQPQPWQLFCVSRLPLAYQPESGRRSCRQAVPFGSLARPSHPPPHPPPDRWQYRRSASRARSGHGGAVGVWLPLRRSPGNEICPPLALDHLQHHLAIAVFGKIENRVARPRTVGGRRRRAVAISVDRRRRVVRREHEVCHTDNMAPSSLCCTG
jgi:hypothetical protein